MVALLMEAGESISAIQRRAGHASARTTSDIYGHVTDEMKRVQRITLTSLILNI